ncbi:MULTISPECIES: ABC transporter ATP-binding protein [Clostridia]|uniref:ABC transporter ATP-binding protein n=1 Tax=Clostridia TaxID=186801 RepID=UPI000EA19D1D|nr:MULTISPECIES: ABC transporter ATP-binding protein [Clostridia]NBJ70123.1 ABC transporter ATP-binding protein [Roseburia sp. 1XD42-34]RKI77080.1 ABC transporter ATP-binding protein [Clostridium sp. 1xD42-85]
MGILSITALSKKFNDSYAVKNMDYQFTPHQCIALIGPNGAGKTTTLRMIAGLLKPTSGNIIFEQNKNIDRRTLIGYLPQHPVFYPWMTGSEFLTYSGQLGGLSKSTSRKRCEELLDIVGIIDVKDKRISSYSGGMKQRLGIAQAMVHKPKLLMLDEPVSSLDPIGRREVLTLMEVLKKEMTILFSTHILSDADEISDELILLRNGEIIESGKIKELRQKYQTTKITLQFAERQTFYEEKIATLANVRNTLVEKDSIQVIANDITKARNEILQRAVQEDWPLLTFRLEQASLEEMFMKAVNHS